MAYLYIFTPEGELVTINSESDWDSSYAIKDTYSNDPDEVGTSYEWSHHDGRFWQEVPVARVPPAFRIQILLLT